MNHPILIITAVLASSIVAPAQNLTDLLQKGLAEEEINRDPAAAIEQYGILLEEFDKGRQLAATALFRIAECHRKLGDEGAAAKNLQQLIALYPKQEKLVVLARQNLTALGVTPALPVPGTTEMSAEEAEAIIKYKTVLRDRPDAIKNSTYISEAVKANHATYTRLLLEQGADPNAKYRTKSTFEAIIETATRNANLSIVKLLLSHGAQVTPESLRRSIQSGYSSIEPLLLDALKEGEPFDYFPALATAIAENSDETFKRLLANGVDPKTLSEKGVSLLHTAARRGRTEACEKLIKTYLLPVNHRDKEGHSALHYAAQERSPETVKALLALGADPKALADSLVEAYGRPGKAKAVSVLMQLLNFYYAQKQTEAIVNIIEQLIAAGIDLNHQDSQGETALHYATKFATETNASRPQAYPRSPAPPRPGRPTDRRIDISTREDLTKIFTALLKGGADMHIKNTYGKAPADLVKGLETAPGDGK